MARKDIPAVIANALAEENYDESLRSVHQYMLSDANDTPNFYELEAWEIDAIENALIKAWEARSEDTYA